MELRAFKNMGEGAIGMSLDDIVEVLVNDPSVIQHNRNEVLNKILWLHKLKIFIN